MYKTKFATKNVSFLPIEEGNLRPWGDRKLEYNLTNET